MFSIISTDTSLCCVWYNSVFNNCDIYRPLWCPLQLRRVQWRTPLKAG